MLIEKPVQVVEEVLVTDVVHTRECQSVEIEKQIPIFVEIPKSVENEKPIFYPQIQVEIQPEIIYRRPVLIPCFN